MYMTNFPGTNQRVSLPQDLHRFCSPIMGEDRLNQMFEQFSSTRLLNGAVVEIGTDLGRTGAFLSACCEHFQIQREIHLFDCFFSGAKLYNTDIMQISDDGTRILNQDVITCDHAAGISACNATFEEFSLSCPHIHAGWLSETLERDLPEILSFVHIDVNFEPCTRQALLGVYPRLCHGAVCFVDDYKLHLFPGVAKAVDSFLADKPETMVQSTKIQGYFVKQ